MCVCVCVCVGGGGGGGGGGGYTCEWCELTETGVTSLGCFASEFLSLTRGKKFFPKNSRRFSDGLSHSMHLMKNLRNKRKCH